MKRSRNLPTATMVLLAVMYPIVADAKQAKESLPDIAAKTAGLERRDGLFPLWIDHDEGRVEIALPSGVGTDAVAVHAFEE